MKLSFDQLSACIHGAIELTRNPDDSVQIHRFTDAQKAIYTPKDAGYFASNQSANTTFDICTDADSITLTFSGRCREQCPEIPADILVNGVLQHHVQATRTAVSSYAVVPYDPVSFTIPLPGGGSLGLSLLVLLLIPAGLYFTIRTKALPVRMFPEMIRVSTEKGAKKEGAISGWQSLIVSTATRVGMGNLMGVVAAISAGGAGAVFWMWITALIGSASAFIEATLAQLHK